MNTIETNTNETVESDIRYNYTQFSQDKHINVIPEHDFKRLVSDTFSTMTQILRSTYGPYGSVVVISDQNETTTTKDGYNVCEAMGFSHIYKRMVYLAIKKICDRVNRNVGDGTTSCILLAEKIFNKINNKMTTPDEKRKMLSSLSKLESCLQNPSVIQNEYDDPEFNMVQPFTMDSFKNIINLAGNYDDDLTSALFDAFDPIADDNGKIISLRSVIPDGSVDRSIGSDINYDISYMPGDYRVRININADIALAFGTKTSIRLAIYDHVFNSTDWNNFIAKYDKETPTIIMATGFNPVFKDNEYVRYCAQRSLVKQPLTVMICAIEGNCVQDEIADLCAVLRTTARKLNDASEVDHDNLPTVNMEIYKGNAMCFYDVTPPEDYINMIEYDMENDNSKSIVKKQNYQNRIDALNINMYNADTLINIKASSSLELKMIMDKIDDCTSIVNSAFDYGIIPNMLKYAYYRINDIQKNTDDTSSIICDAIKQSIIGLFDDIWTSKFTIDTDINTRDDIRNTFYTNNDFDNKSYDIINNKFVDMTTLPTSAQYDMEVVAAAISIVKYLTTSRALIFDAHLQKPVDDIDIMNSRL